MGSVLSVAGRSGMRGIRPDVAGCPAVHNAVMASSAPGGRIRFADQITFWAPESLGELRGPSSGTVRPGLDVWWSGQDGAQFDVSSDEDAALLYQAVLRVGSAADVEGTVNAVRLREVWGMMVLPERVRRAWLPLLGRAC